MKNIVMNSKFTYLTLLLVFIKLAFGYAQETKNKDSMSIFDRYLIFEGDTLLIELDEIKLLGKLSFKSDYDRRYYYWYRKKTLNAYPYAKLAADRLEVLNERLAKIGIQPQNFSELISSIPWKEINSYQ